jgi:hypothetical protein
MNFISINVERVTYFGWEEPEEQTGVVLLVHGEEARITRNVLRNWSITDSGHNARFFNVTILNVWCKDQCGAHVIFNRNRILLDIIISQGIR